MSQRIGYGRVSKRDQNPDALHAASCDKIFVDKASGKFASRPELDAALAYARAGDVLVVTRLSRAARSLDRSTAHARTLVEVAACPWPGSCLRWWPSRGRVLGTA